MSSSTRLLVSLHTLLDNYHSIINFDPITFTALHDVLERFAERLERIESITTDTALDSKRSNILFSHVAKEVIIQHRLRMDVWTDSKRSKCEQAEFKERLIKFYNCAHPIDKGVLRCMVMNKYFPREKVIASHIWKYSTRGTGLEEFGLKESDITSERNGVLICENIEDAFDSKRVCFLIDRLKSDNIFLKVLDPSLMGNLVIEGHPRTFQNIDGKQLHNPPGSIPYRRILDWHAKCAYQSAKSRGWIEYTDSFNDFFNMSLGSSIPDLNIYQDL